MEAIWPDMYTKTTQVSILIFTNVTKKNYCLILYVIVFNLILFCMLLSLQHREPLTLVSHMRKLWQFDVDVPMEGWFPTKMAVTDLADLAKTDH
jgi:hypothetical protein